MWNDEGTGGHVWLWLGLQSTQPYDYNQKAQHVMVAVLRKVPCDLNTPEAQWWVRNITLVNAVLITPRLAVTCLQVPLSRKRTVTCIAVNFVWVHNHTKRRRNLLRQVYDPSKLCVSSTCVIKPFGDIVWNVRNYLLPSRTLNHRGLQHMGTIFLVVCVRASFTYYSARKSFLPVISRTSEHLWFVAGRQSWT